MNINPRFSSNLAYMLESTDHRPRDDPRGRTGVSGAARGLLATVGTTALLLAGATNYSPVLEITLCECFQDGWLQLVIRRVILRMRINRITSRDHPLV